MTTASSEDSAETANTTVFWGCAPAAVELMFVIANTASDERSSAAKSKLRLLRGNRRSVFLKRIVSPQGYWNRTLTEYTASRFCRTALVGKSREPHYTEIGLLKTIEMRLD